MHELTIASHILELAEAEARKAGCRTITGIELEIGKLAGVEHEALHFGFTAVCRDSLAEKASLNIITTPATAKCSGCGVTFPVQSYFDPCPKCASSLNTIIQGEELRLVTVNAE